jgi:cytidine deaminase
MEHDRLLDTLIERARAASDRAYCPYSQFRVGAALLTTSDEIYTGCNVENASYGLTICAERSCVFRMVAEGEQEIHTLVIYTPTPTPAAPCGACRQVINEFGPESRIVCVCDSADRIDATLNELLPRTFASPSQR